MFFTTVILAVREISRHKLRSFLTVLGIVIGVAAVVTMVTLGNGATAAVTQQIDLAPYPAVKRIFETAMALPEFARAHPAMQPDTPEAMRVKK